MKLLSALLSVRSIIWPLHVPVAGLLLWAWPHRDIDQLQCGRFAAVGLATQRYQSIAAWLAHSSKYEQCHSVS